MSQGVKVLRDELWYFANLTTESRFRRWLPGEEVDVIQLFLWDIQYGFPLAQAAVTTAPPHTSTDRDQRDSIQSMESCHNDSNGMFTIGAAQQ